MISGAERLGRWAVDALEQGFDSQSLRMLASCAFSESSDKEARKLLPLVFRELELPEPSPKLRHRFAEFHPEKLDFEYLVEGVPSEAWGRYDGMTQFGFCSRHNTCECLVNPLGDTEPEIIGDIPEDDWWGIGDGVDPQQSLVITIEPYGGNGDATSEMPSAEMKRIISACVFEYLRGHRYHKTMSKYEFERDIVQRRG